MILCNMVKLADAHQCMMPLLVYVGFSIGLRVSGVFQTKKTKIYTHKSSKNVLCSRKLATKNKDSTCAGFFYIDFCEQFSLFIIIFSLFIYLFFVACLWSSW